MRSRDSAGRKYAEGAHPYRGPFQRDRDRIVHSSAYRRLSSKTQVFVGVSGDYHRTRLTHTLEVASVSRTLSRALALNEDLTEALALAHDLGHPPFGHAGETALAECLATEGGFCHNEQALRIVEELEARYPGFPGLNLSSEVLEGQRYRVDKSAAASPLIEVQVVEAADSVTYDTHDADDALELGLVALDDLLGLPLWREAARRARRAYSALSDDQLRRAVLHELIDWQVSDLVTQAGRRLAELGVDSASAARQAPIIVATSVELDEQKRELEAFLFERVYRHSAVSRPCRLAQRRLAELFALLAASPQLLPPRYRARAQSHGPARSVGDYVAGMTDRYFKQEYERLTGQSFEDDDR
jgi:dGTPase